MSNIYYSIVLTIQVLSAIAVIGLVLVQHGKGADMGAAFGSGASGSLFGATGSANFLSRSTAVAAALFFTTTLGLAWLSNSRTAAPRSIMDQVTPPVSSPAAPAGGVVLPPVAVPPASAPPASVPPASAPPASAPASSVPSAVPALSPGAGVPPTSSAAPAAAPAVTAPAVTAPSASVPTKAEPIKLDTPKVEMSKDAPK